MGGRERTDAVWRDVHRGRVWRAQACRVVEEWPFPTGWEDWRPDPAWPIPQLPDGWDRV